MKKVLFVAVEKKLFNKRLKLLLNDGNLSKLHPFVT